MIPVSYHPDLTGANFDFRVKATEAETGFEHVTDRVRFDQINSAADIEELLDNTLSPIQPGVDEISKGFNVTGDGVQDDPWRILFGVNEKDNFDDLEIEFPDVTYGRNRTAQTQTQSLFFINNTPEFYTEFKLNVRWFDTGGLLSESATDWIPLEPDATTSQHEEIEAALRGLNLPTDDDISVLPLGPDPNSPSLNPVYLINFGGSANYALMDVTIASNGSIREFAEDITEVVEVEGSGVENDPWIMQFPGYINYEDVSLGRLAGVPDLQYLVTDVGPELTVTGFGTENAPWVIDFGANAPTSGVVNAVDYSPLLNSLQMTQSITDISRIFVNEDNTDFNPNQNL